MKPLQYVEMEPAPDVAHIVMTYWGFTVYELPTPDFVHRVWPDGCVSLAMAFSNNKCSAAVIVGASAVAGAVPVRAGEQYWGIRFRPETGALYCRRSATSLRDHREPALAVFGETCDALTTALGDVTNGDAAANLMEAFVRSHPFRAEQRIDALVCGAVQHMVRTGGTCSIQAVADALQVSMRQLQRRFRTATGLTPKEYASIRRARSALKRIAMGENLRIRCGWARLAADLGYADQAHLSREVARLLAFSPTQLSKWLDNISHSHLVD